MSPKLDNKTPFSAEVFEQLTGDGDAALVVAARGTFDIVPNAPLALAGFQTPFGWTDEYDGDPVEGRLLRQADFIAFKPATDVTVFGHTYAPGGRSRATWPFGIRVLSGGKVRAERRLNVHGPRYWEAVSNASPSKKGLQAPPKIAWQLSDSRQQNTVALDWRYAFGGPLAPEKAGGEPGHDLDNPIGFGMPDAQGTDAQLRWPAPLIEDAFAPITSANQRYAPQNLSPIPPSWHFRHCYAGTYDERWQNERYPLLPKDFDYRFYQCAHPDLVLAPWLEGGETMQLVNLHPSVSQLSFILPGLLLLANEGGREMNLRLDGVHIYADAGQVELTWRIGFLGTSGVDGVTLQLADARRGT